MRKLPRAFLFFSRTERRGLIVWMILILLVILVEKIYSYRQAQRTFTAEALEAQKEAVKDYQAFIASVRQKESEEKRRRQSTWYSSPGENALVLTLFDPNTADSATFRQLGLPGWMARNILRYREKGGKFRRPDDFRKIYGLTEEQYHTLSPYIRIAQTDTAHARPSLFLSEARTDSFPQKAEKYAPGTKIDLNRADTTELKKIPGIGSGIARLISGYRQQLGGFYNLSQLEDIDLDYRQLADWFRIDTTAIRRIPVNRASVDRLRRHPYLNFYQAKVLVEYRRKHGPLKSLKPFVLYEEFTRENLERIGHYLSFE